MTDAKTSKAQIEEALAALRDIRDHMTANDGHIFKRLITGLGLVEATLGTALTEAEALQAMEDWMRTYRSSVQIYCHTPPFYAISMRTPITSKPVADFHGDTRAQAFKKAGIWCTTELAKR